jgi:hypothetical protein
LEFEVKSKNKKTINLEFIDENLLSYCYLEGMNMSELIPLCLLDVRKANGRPNPTSFKAFYKPLENEASQTGGGVFLDLNDLKGQRIGTYLMFRVVQWLKQWPGSTMVNCIRVSAVDAKGKTNTDVIGCMKILALLLLMMNKEMVNQTLSR